MNYELAKQLKDVASLWWKRYFADREFRLKQEAEAYGAQYAYLCTRIKDGNKRARILWVLAEHLSGPMYDLTIGHSAAMSLIRKYGEKSKAQ